MDELFGDWSYIEAPPKKAHSTNTSSNNEKQDRREVLWVNYEVPMKGTEYENQQQFSTTLYNGH
jgi:hypothetical protein